MQAALGSAPGGPDGSQAVGYAGRVEKQYQRAGKAAADQAEGGVKQFTEQVRLYQLFLLWHAQPRQRTV